MITNDAVSRRRKDADFITSSSSAAKLCQHDSFPVLGVAPILHPDGLAGAGKMEQVLTLEAVVNE
jgi:hypothetical protein